MTPDPNPSRPTELRGVFRQPLFIAVAQALLSALFLALITNWQGIYEEDQMAKTAQIMSLATHSNWAHFSQATDYYNKDVFSAYYLAATVFYKISHLPPVVALTSFSVVCGVIFFAVTPAFLRRVFDLPEWLSWAALISAPILPISFSYGNEAAFAIVMTVLSAFTLTIDRAGTRILAAFFFVLAAYSRSDYLFLWPALASLTFARRSDSSMNWKRSGRGSLVFTSAALVLGLLYLAVVLRHFPKPFFGEAGGNLKLALAFFVYSLNPVIFVFALAGIGLALNRAREKYLLLALVFLQFIPYLGYFNSPKYSLPSAVALIVFALAGMLPLLKRARWAVVVLLLLPWFFSFSPYGIFGPARSVFWFIPSDDGPLPTGGFVGFYSQVKHGFYQARYRQEGEQVEAVMSLIDKAPGRANIVGPFNMQTLRLWEAQHARWTLATDYAAFWKPDLGEAGDGQTKFMLKSTYLYVLKHEPKLREQLYSVYQQGRVRAVSENFADPFPDLMECGDSVPAGSDPDLAARIIFLDVYFQGNQVLRWNTWLEDFSAASWVPRSRAERGEFKNLKPLYQDSKWVCFAENIPGAIYYSPRFPFIYNASRTNVKSARSVKSD